MIKIGITGGIGSGKTTVCKIFQVMGVPVYCADIEARKLTDTHPDIIKPIKGLFGNDIYEGGLLNRKRVASIVFNEKEKLTRLNQIIHPVVNLHFVQWLDENKNFPIVVKEAAILFESGGDKDMDKVISVCAPIDLRIQRVMERDGLTVEQVRNRINNQMSEEERISKSDFVIRCNDIDLVIPQVLSLYNKLCSFTIDC